MPAPIRRKINRKYRDLDLDMLVHPHTGDLVARVDDSAINASLMAIIKTKKGEKPFDPNFGSTIYNSLFEPFHPTTSLSLQARIKSTINIQEPRVKLHSVVVDANESKNGYSVTITYSPINENRVVDMIFFLERLR
jgi:phage baseplate assembly protein W